jgi:hypothetical protein
MTHEVIKWKVTISQAMIAANFAVCACTAVDPVNVLILLLKLEVEKVERYNKQLEKAWSHGGDSNTTWAVTL